MFRQLVALRSQNIVFLISTDHFSGPDRAIDPLCVCVCGQ